MFHSELREFPPRQKLMQFARLDHPCLHFSFHRFLNPTPAVSRANSRSDAGAEAVGVGSSALLDEAATRREKHLKSVYNSRGVQFRAP